MDDVIKGYSVVNTDEDLVYCEGLAYQRDMSKSVPYDRDYFETYVRRENTAIARRINAARTSLTEKYCTDCILDVGIGSGEFIKSSKLKVFGYDINPYGIDWLKSRSLFVDPYEHIPNEVQGLTLWDTMEHMKNPQELLCRIPAGKYVFISLPTFEAAARVKQSKHYKPNEHYYYFTVPGMIRYMQDSGFAYVEHNDEETKAGREGVTAFAFVR